MAQARTEFAAALNQIASEKGVDVSVVLEAIRSAALAAYRKDLMLRNEVIPDDFEGYTSEVDPITGEIIIWHGKDNVTPPGFARIAASIARQVILQRLYEAEKGAIMDEYGAKVGSIVSGVIQRQEGNTYFVDLGRAEGVLPPPEQVPGELYHSNQRLKFYIKEIREGKRGPEVVVSRSDAGLVKRLFALEVPEIQSGGVDIKFIAREAGSRTKIAASSDQDGVDPVGSLVGQKGVRVQAVMSELGEEKIDIISYSADEARFIAAALSPAKDIQVKLDQENKVATVSIPTSQLSLAIGRGGQNVRLAAKLTGWKIDIEGIEESAELAPKATEVPAEVTIASESPEEGRIKAEEESTDPDKNPGEAIADAVEENITEVMQEESVAGEIQEAPVVDDPKAAADALSDISEEISKEQKVDEPTK